MVAKNTFLESIGWHLFLTYFSPNCLISQSSSSSSGVHSSVTLGSVCLGESALFLSLKPSLWGVYFSKIDTKCNIIDLIKIRIYLTLVYHKCITQTAMHIYK